ncbi:MAG: YqeG family HAD IIIA-type phosphatase [Lachnospiraceae bacterium]|nr:YqeG family HAD IIIA-type phosphatase [Lachnospiraceae bacterium]MBR5738701.1 YqeG family HAD IIIA-type phosphatase [Lachnospiraceae bacterium]
MIRYFVPDRREHSVYSMDFKKEYAEGIRGIIFDIDNTLVPQNAPVDSRAEALFRVLREDGIETCLISNNGETRVKTFADDLGSHYVPNAAKPSRKAYRKAMEVMGTDLTNTLFIGDQLLTDIFGAKRAGVRSILVDPVDPKSDLLRIRFKRKIEALILFLAGSRMPKKST